MGADQALLEEWIRNRFAPDSAPLGCAAGGSFTNAGGTPANSIARWDGTHWLALGSGLGGTNYDETTVNALAVSGHDLYDTSRPETARADTTDA